MTAAFQQLVVRRHGQVLVARVVAEKRIGPRVMDALYRDLGTIAAECPAGVVLDLTRVQFLDSSILRPLIRLNTSLRSRKAQLFVCGLEPQLREVWRITKLDHVFRVEDAVEGALTKLSEFPSAERQDPPPVCSTGPWPKEPDCRVCRAAFCSECGSRWQRACQQHKAKTFFRKLAAIGRSFLPSLM
jgi:anti-sigma B factor antagonist